MKNEPDNMVILKSGENSIAVIENRIITFSEDKNTSFIEKLKRVLEAWKENYSEKEVEKGEKYTGYVMCADDGGMKYYTKGKIYRIVDGVLIDNYNNQLYATNPIKNFAELEKVSIAKWIEITDMAQCYGSIY